MIVAILYREAVVRFIRPGDSYVSRAGGSQEREKSNIKWASSEIRYGEPGRRGWKPQNRKDFVHDEFSKLPRLGQWPTAVEGQIKIRVLIKARIDKWDAERGNLEEERGLHSNRGNELPDHNKGVIQRRSHNRFELFVVQAFHTTVIIKADRALLALSGVFKSLFYCTEINMTLTSTLYMNQVILSLQSVSSDHEFLLRIALIVGRNRIG